MLPFDDNSLPEPINNDNFLLTVDSGRKLHDLENARIQLVARIIACVAVLIMPVGPKDSFWISFVFGLFLLAFALVPIFFVPRESFYRYSREYAEIIVDLSSFWALLINIMGIVVVYVAFEMHEFLFIPFFIIATPWCLFNILFVYHL